MRLKKPIAILLELLILLALGGWLYHVWKTRPPLPTQSSGDKDEDDLKYNPRVPVSIGRIERATLRGYLDAYGTVEPEPAIDGQSAAVANISSPTVSLISSANCVEGQLMKKGDVLFTAGNSDITAPIDGTVTLLTVHPGEVALPRRVAVQLVDLNRLVIAASVPAAQLREAQVGQEAEIAALGSTTRPSRLTSRVSFIDPQVDSKTGLGSVDVKVPAAANLKPGEFVSVRMVTLEHRDCLVVPAQSIARDDSGQPGISLVMRDHEWAVRQPVKIGLREGDQVEISGADLQPGTLIVTTGAAALPDRSRIEINK